MSRASRLSALVLVIAVTGVAVPATALAIPVITASGSTSVAPLYSLLAKKYLQVKHLKGKLKFKLAQGGSDVGVADVAAGRVDIGNSSRDPKPTDAGGLVFNKIAKDAICMITNTSNPIANLTKAQIVSIFSGSVRNWEDVAGSKTTGPIDLVGRTAASGTQDAFQKIFMGSAVISSTISAKASNGLVQSAVQTDKNAIGYVSADFTPGTNAAAYEGVACNVANAKSGQYGGVRSFYMVTRGPARGAVAKWIAWAANAPSAKKITGTHWVPLS